MQKFEFKSWKSLAILIAICVIFLLLVIQAFQYIPEESNIKPLEGNYEENIDNTFNENSDLKEKDNEDHQNSEQEISKIEEEMAHAENPHNKMQKWSFKDNRLDKYTNDEIEGTPNKEEISERYHEFSHGETNIPDLEPIDSQAVENREIDTIEQLFKIERKAREYKEQKAYKEAIQEYNNYLKICNDPYRKLEAYDNLAILYAITNDYENAIGCAQQAFKIQPSSEREFILTKLYYKSGDVDKATDRINKILQKDFELR